MFATRLTREDSGKLIEGLNDFSNLLENLGIESGSVVLMRNGDIHSTFIVDNNLLLANIEQDGKKETVWYDQ